MRKLLIQMVAVAMSAGLMTACSAGAGGGQPTSSAPSATSSAPSPTSTGTATPSDTTAPDTETSVPAPAPPAPTGPPAGPGAGNAELAIMVKPSDTEAALNYTLVCQGGVPSAESKHPGPEAACSALKENPSILSPSTKNTAQACTEQYGGPQTATVTGIVDDTPVDATFARTNGCEISAWNAAQPVLGSSGGAA
ncbi:MULTISPECIES: serine protease inhibitor [unclassified Pseudarthrobacter]|uniref:serine protease inhibitor n=1 Tax=unclassified Pseudarthrobacter TaxID=2647000 RepID=UPI003077D508